MKTRLELTFEARSDLIEIWEYIALDDELAADRFFEKLQAECQRLAKLKAMGRTRANLSNGILSFAFRRYVIFFTREARKTTILRVVHGARDHSRVFED